MDFRAELYARGGYRLDESLVGFFVVVVVVVVALVFRRTDSRRTEKTPATCTATKPATNTVTMIEKTTTEQRELHASRRACVLRVLTRAFSPLFLTTPTHKKHKKCTIRYKKEQVRAARFSFTRFEKKKKRKMMHRKIVKGLSARMFVYYYYVWVCG